MHDEHTCSRGTVTSRSCGTVPAAALTITKVVTANSALLAHRDVPLTLLHQAIVTPVVAL